MNLDNASQPAPPPSKPASKRLSERIIHVSDEKKSKLNHSNQSMELLEENTRRRMFWQLQLKSQYYLSVCTDQSPLPGNWSLSQVFDLT